MPFRRTFVRHFVSSEVFAKKLSGKNRLFVTPCDRTPDIKICFANSKNPFETQRTKKKGHRDKQKKRKEWQHSKDRSEGFSTPLQLEALFRGVFTWNYKLQWN